MPFALAGCAFATQAPAEGYGDLGVSLHPAGAMVSIFTWTEQGRAIGWIPREQFAELIATLSRPDESAADILSRMQGNAGGCPPPRFTAEQMAAVLRTIAPLCDGTFVYKGKKMDSVEAVVRAAADRIEGTDDVRS